MYPEKESRAGPGLEARINQVSRFSGRFMLTRQVLGQAEKSILRSGSGPVLATKVTYRHSDHWPGTQRWDGSEINPENQFTGQETDQQDPWLAMGMDIGMGVTDGDKHNYALARAETNSIDLSLNAAAAPSMGSVPVEAPGQDSQGN